MMAGANSVASLTTLASKTGIAAGGGIGILSWLLVFKFDSRDGFDIRLFGQEVMQELRQLLLA
jgi:hypothetical protein